MRKVSIQFGSVIVIALLFASCQKQTVESSSSVNDEVAQRRAAISTNKSHSQLSASVTVFSTGLMNPRGLEFGPDGNLYVAEGGPGGTHSTIGTCTQVVFPVGPYLGSPTGGRISKINSAGVRTTVADNFPSSAANEIIGGDVEGVADIAFIGNDMYALLAGAGCSHGVTSMNNGVVKVAPDGSWSMIADISSYLYTHPVAHPEEDDFEPDGTPYSMISVRGDLYAVEPNHGEVMKITTDGQISRVVDVSASQGHVVPTVLEYHGNFFLGNLDTFPIPGGGSKIFKVNPGGQLKVWATGLNTVLGLVIDKNDRMYVLENTVGAPFPTEGMGKIIRIDPSGTQTEIASGLSLPTGMTMGPDGNLYVSNIGLGPVSTAGGGEVLKVSLK